MSDSIKQQALVSDARSVLGQFFKNPHPVHEALREAGPVVRYEQVHAMLNDWQSFSLASGVGLADFRKEKPWRLPSLVLETDPPLHDRTRDRQANGSLHTALQSRHEFTFDAGG